MSPGLLPGGREGYPGAPQAHLVRPWPNPCAPASRLPWRPRPRIPSRMLHGARPSGLNFTPWCVPRLGPAPELGLELRLGPAPELRLGLELAPGAPRAGPCVEPCEPLWATTKLSISAPIRPKSFAQSIRLSHTPALQPKAHESRHGAPAPPMNLPMAHPHSP
jgi:hypothetical protein